MGETVQSCAEHCANTAGYAEECLSVAGLRSSARLVGMIHDMGKLTESFREYINKSAHGEKVRKGSVNHSFAGVKFLFERYHKPNGEPMSNMSCEILAYAAGAHHGQFDCLAPDGSDGFEHRLSAELALYKEAKVNFCTPQILEELDELFEKSVCEIGAIIKALRELTNDTGEMCFYVSLVCRLLLSALIDADRQDTAEFMLSQQFPNKTEGQGALWSLRLAAVEERLESLPLRYPVDHARRTISRQCGQAPAEASGIYRLPAPTGSGKTLASLRFALATAARHNKRRLIFVTPLLGVLEQNAKVIREYLQDDSLILEHHSNVVHTEEDSDELDVNELMLENWNSPLIITTFVQLLNSLFDGRGSSVRRMQALQGAVIVIDEVQSLSKHMTSQFNLAMNFLAHICHATVLLCSATQPCLEEVKHPLLPPRDILEYDEKLWSVFKRTQIFDRRKAGGYTPEELAGLAIDHAQELGSVLIICNKKQQAAQIYKQLRHSRMKAFHLSTSMCMANRIDKYSEINLSLGKEPLICVATQLVEAGVDLSFGCVIRVIAGMDNVVQAAGRGNRHGGSAALCPVYIVNFRGEDLSRLKDIRQAQIATEELLVRYSADSSIFKNDLQSDTAISYFYRRLYGNMPQGAQDYYLPEHKSSIYRLLAMNQDFRGRSRKAYPYTIGQAFKTAGAEFKVFEDNTVDVLVPYRAGAELIAELCSSRAVYDLAYRKQLLEQSKMHSVSVFSYQLELLRKNGGVGALFGEAIWLVLPNFYSEDLGINFSGDINELMEV